MIQSVEQTVEQFRRTMEKVRAQTNTPAKARAFLLRLGIIEKHKRSPNGVRLAKRYR